MVPPADLYVATADLYVATADLYEATPWPMAHSLIAHGVHSYLYNATRRPV